MLVTKYKVLGIALSYNEQKVLLRHDCPCHEKVFKAETPTAKQEVNLDRVRVLYSTYF